MVSCFAQRSRHRRPAHFRKHGGARSDVRQVTSINGPSSCLGAESIPEVARPTLRARRTDLQSVATDRRSVLRSAPVPNILKSTTPPRGPSRINVAFCATRPDHQLPSPFGRRAGGEGIGEPPNLAPDFLGGPFRRLAEQNGHEHQPQPRSAAADPAPRLGHPFQLCLVAAGPAGSFLGTCIPWVRRYDGGTRWKKWVGRFVGRNKQRAGRRSGLALTDSGAD